MRNILYTLFFLGISFNDFAQIFGKNEENNPNFNYGVTISPKGISSNNKPSLPATNTGLGSGAINNAFTAANNTAIGYRTLSMQKNDSPDVNAGNNNTAIGTLALFRNTDGYNNSAFGISAMGTYDFITGIGNCAFGNSALFNVTSGNNNAAFGPGTLFKIKTGIGNAAFGTNSANATSDGNNLAAFGVSTLAKHINGNNSTVFGTFALGNDQSGIGNAVFGVHSMVYNASGSSNTAFGTNTLYTNDTGSSNVALGIEALYQNNENNNIAVGAYALRSNTAGLKNVSLGYSTLFNNTIGSRNVAIGTNAGYSEIGNDKLYIQSDPNNLGGKTLIGGNFAANKVCIACEMYPTGDSTFYARTEAFQVHGQAFKTAGSGNWVIPSDRRLKTDIISLNTQDMLQKIRQMQGVSYTLIANPQEGTQYGFIAQDLRLVFPTKVYENKTGYLSASYGAFTPIFVEALKALNERIENLEQNYADIKSITARLDEWEKRASK